MSVTIREAELLVKKAIENGAILKTKTAQGDTITIGPYPQAVGALQYASFVYRRYGRFSGKGVEDIINRDSWHVAGWFVARTGRGEAAKVAREALQYLGKFL